MVSCGICDQMDPPAEVVDKTDQTIEWVGCDCLRWFHKPCTKLTKFTEKFSCKSVRMRCQEVELPPEPASFTLQFAILKFVRDRDITFMEDLL